MLHIVPLVSSGSVSLVLPTDHMALDLLRCVTALRQLTGMHISAVSASAVGDHAPCCSNVSPQQDEGRTQKTDKMKNTRLRREFARLSGWLTLVDPNAQHHRGGAQHMPAGYGFSLPKAAEETLTGG